MRNLSISLLLVFISSISIANDDNYPKDYLSQAENWNAEGLHMMGYMYLSGNGMPQDQLQAVKWFRKAANKGHARAQFALGNAYYYGEGVAVNYKKSAYWYEKAAAQGHTPAQFSLGDFYYFGQGVKQNNVNAYAWWELTEDAWGQGSLGNRKNIMANMKPQQRFYGKHKFEQLHKDIALR